MSRLILVAMLMSLLSCSTDPADGRLEGDWSYQSSGNEAARFSVMEKILSDTPPSEEALRGMGLSGDDLSAGIQTLRLKLDSPDDPGLARIQAEFEAARARKQAMTLEVRGEQMVLSIDSRRHVSQFEVESEDGDKMRLKTTSSDGLSETQILTWISETHIRIADPQGRAMDFVRP